VDPDGDPAFVLTYPIEPRPADEIYFCQLCLHDFA
jgi:hypothetical protein